MSKTTPTPEPEKIIDRVLEILFEQGILTGLGKNPLSAQESKQEAKARLLALIDDAKVKELDDVINTYYSLWKFDTPTTSMENIVKVRIAQLKGQHNGK